MKMIRRTSTTSTSGVTLMSGATPLRDRRLGNPLTPELLSVRGCRVLRQVLDDVDQLAGRRGERELVVRDLRREPVEGAHGRDRDREAERRLDERLADAGRYRGKAAGARSGDTLEGRDDA